ncbi:hypothetical protein BO99DRAFT_263975 [Aspergillus violaceofuscus CBS 115571]|uniref:Uncharacterized protein n=1 Tax=Aspergillus violaceofuscus (strain CBS 115571) TaxID=1450538 RepID=A0A2V5GUP0_ASPV1|nr:hypothetical protein BO99DRAFT_263975 [Aspergillus violaceofuscus CBS 115571]
MAHLGARQTEDLEVAGSSPARPILFGFVLALSLCLGLLCLLGGVTEDLEVIGSSPARPIMSFFPFRLSWCV